MASKSRRFKIIGALITVLILGIVVVVLLEYGQVRGFKNTLIDLVSEKSEGKLSLDLGTTKINYYDLSFQLDSVVLRTTDTSKHEGIQSVIVPILKVNIGSLFHYAFTRQMVIEEIVISEPYAEVILKKKEEKKPARVNIAHELAQFAPGIGAILENFEIQSFRIERAATDLEPENGNDIRISLIDLLIENWNMRDLSSDAQINLEIRNQDFQFNRSDFSFENVEYNYQQHELKINNFSFLSRDTLGREVLSLDGKLIAVTRADFNALLENEEYIFGHLQITDPVVTANVYPKDNDPEVPRSRSPVSDLLKENLGTLLLDSGHLNNATLHLNIHRPSDSIKVSLPGIYMEVEKLQVREDSATMLIEEFRLRIDSALIDLNEDIEVAFSGLEYDREYNILFDGLKLLHKAKNKEILRLDHLALYNFSVFNYLYENLIECDSVLLRNGVINRYEPLKETFSGVGQQKKKKSTTPPEILMGRLIIENIELLFELPDGEIKAKDLSALVENIANENKLTYDLRYISAPSINISHPAGTLDIENIFFRTRNFSLKRARFTSPDVSVELDNIFAQPEDFQIEKPDGKSWDKVEIGYAEVTGDISGFAGKKKDPAEKRPLNLKFDHVIVDSMQVDIQKGDSLSLSFLAKGLEVQEWASSDGELLPDFFEGSLFDIQLSRPEMSLRAGEITLNSKGSSYLTGLSMTTDSRDSVVIPDISIRQLSHEGSMISSEELVIHSPAFYHQSGTFAQIDSLVISEVFYKKDSLPRAKRAEVYGPLVTMVNQEKAVKDGENESKTPKDHKKSFQDILDQLIIHPGKLSLNEKEIGFGEINVDLSGKERMIVEANAISFDSENANMSIGRIMSDDQHITINDFLVTPAPGYAESLEFENDVVDATFPVILIENVPWDSVYSSGHVLLPGIRLEDFHVGIRRDKILPDPEPVNKPFMLTSMIPLPENMTLEKIAAVNGSLSYFERGEKTGKTGHIDLTEINLEIWPNGSPDETTRILEGSLKVYDNGRAAVIYRELDTTLFDLEVQLTDMDLPLFNQMVDSLESVRIKSGYLSAFGLSVRADSAVAAGRAIISYSDLHIEIFKRGQPEVRNLGSELLTFLADGIILKNSKEDAIADVSQERITFKGPFNYWIKSLIKGAIGTVRKGKRPK